VDTIFHIKTISVKLKRPMVFAPLAFVCFAFFAHVWATPPATYYAINGAGNNVENPLWGAANQPMVRVLTPANYADDVGAVDTTRPSARWISNTVGQGMPPQQSAERLSALAIWWGQWIDHGFILTEPHPDTETLNITVPDDDPVWNTTEPPLAIQRIQYVAGEGGVRAHINLLSSFIDGSMIYGHTEDRADALRAHVDGKLATSDDEEMWPPRNPSVCNVTMANPTHGPEADLFCLGDPRGNEQPALTALHVVWMREHNFHAEMLGLVNPDWDDEQLYQAARRLVIAELQAITYNEWLPTLLGAENAAELIGEYTGYDNATRPDIAEYFASAAFRFGHAGIMDQVPECDETCTRPEDGSMGPWLADVFFTPNATVEVGVTQLLRGAATTPAKSLNTLVVPSLRNLLFGPRGDLLAFNIERGRDFGLPLYGEVRTHYNLTVPVSWSEVTGTRWYADRLAEAYPDGPETADLFVGMLAEDHLPGAAMGPLLAHMLADQFKRTRDGDRFWYQNEFSAEEQEQVESVALADVIRRTVSSYTEMDCVPNVAFRVPRTTDPCVAATRTSASTMALSIGAGTIVLLALVGILLCAGCICITQACFHALDTPPSQRYY
jgi:hypothetical protein